MRRLPALALLLSVSAVFNAQVSHSDPTAAADALCKQIIAAAPPAPADAGSFKSDCDSSAFYFGIGRPRDSVAARQCAFAERAKPSSTSSSIFAGPGVLSMIYANGEGTPRNTALARRFVCENNWSAPAEIHFRLNLLEQIDKTATPPHFDLCDTATSGLSQGWCQSIDSDLSRIERDRKIEQLVSNLPPDAKTSFASLKRAEATYELARAENEVDLSGTGRAAWEYEEEDTAADEFLANLRSLENPAPVSSAAPRAADEQLNLAYALVRKTLPPKEDLDSRFGTLSFDGVQKTERAWLHLRDRWMDFIRIAHPSYPSDVFLAHLIEQRTKQLRSLLPS